MGERNGGAIEKRILLSFSRKLSRYSQEGQFSRILLSNGSSLFRSVFVSRAPTKKARSLPPSLHRNCLPIEIKAQIYFNRCAVERKERPPPLIFPSLPPPFLDLHPPEIYIPATTNFCGSSFRRKRLITIGRTMYYEFLR